MSGRKKKIEYRCTGCNKEICTIDKILYNMRCKPCFISDCGIDTDPWTDVERRGREMMKKNENKDD